MPERTKEEIRNFVKQRMEWPEGSLEIDKDENDSVIPPAQ